MATTVTRQGLALLSEDTAHGTLYSRDGLLPCPAMALMNKLSSLLWVGGLGTDASCLGYNGCSGTFETGYSLGTPFLSFPLPFSGETCWVTQSVTWEASCQPLEQWECLGSRSPCSYQALHDCSYGCHLREDGPSQSCSAMSVVYGILTRGQ